MNKSSFEIVRLSSDSVQKIRDALPPKNSNPAWFLIGGQPKYGGNTTEPSEVDKPANNDSETTSDEKQKFHESQFFFTQVARPIFHEKIENAPVLIIEDVIKTSVESLEQSNGRHDFLIFKNLSTEELSNVAEALKNNLSETGLSNLCKSITNMNTEQSLQLLPTLCSQVLLPKIIELEKDSCLIKTGICECATRFPDDIQNLIFNASLNTDPKSTSIIIALVQKLGIQKYSSLLSEFANHTRELKQWHFSILETISSTAAEANAREKIFKMFAKKAMTFSKDKRYALLVQTFAKTNAPFSEEEKLILEEIAALNQTAYKKLIEKYSRS
ncbi:uncharacterized protein LOC117172890 [Belonocnema kinseyi]|uniref:uncharacterized protein LOC117172890 n=1 Tax=Belonocnema kinseyi TaxID=2817044 RepID=UPI00143DDC89|nr:uncharacterized protein LOC117172890 [Belonocnema kinseyi]